AALGAGRARIVRQLLTESMLLGLLAAGLGLLVAEGGLRLLLATAPPGVPRLAAARIDLWTLGFTMAATVVATLLFGLVPAYQVSRLDVRSGLALGGRGAVGGGGRDRLRRALVVAEVGLSLTLLVGAGLLVRTGLNLGHASLGFEPDGLLTARIGFPKEGYATHEKAARAFEAVVDRLRSRPEVKTVALVSRLPLSGNGGSNGLIPEGRALDMKSVIDTDLQIVSPGYFEAMRIPLRAGRTLTDEDRRGAPRVMVIGEELARVAFPGQDPIGRRIACCEDGDGTNPAWKVVVGVVGNVSTSGPGAPARPQFYLPLDQVPAEAWDWISRTLGVVVRGGDKSARLAPVIREAVRSVDPAVPVYDVRTMSERRRRATAQERFGAVLLSTLGALGLVLAAAGIYGVIAYFVSQRTREIAVRLAMGAQTRDVVALVFGQGLRPALLGMALGTAGALFAGRALRAVLFGVGAADPVTFLVVAGLLLAVAGLAGVLPARRAARVDPARALAEG
ncbi:MAG TPA: FtsX-like permease family protein, partial [Vicinamibacteria bacterium]|nr:FtsX-like permease family protein [Vicinamibacteria bacterium]